MKRRYRIIKRQPHVRQRRRRPRVKFFIIIALFLAALAAALIFWILPSLNAPPPEDTGSPSSTASTAPAVTDTPTPTPVPSLSDDLLPHPTQTNNQNTDPESLSFTTKIYVGDTEQSAYDRPDKIYFGTGDEYTELEGVTTFRGNNYRDAASWGTAVITEEALEKMRDPKKTGSLNQKGGAAWTGQPLVVKWPAETRSKMASLYDDFRNKDGFTEVILASYDGRIYFMELSTGEKTRDPINIGSPTKGTPTLDPRGYPIIYVGQGLNPEGNPEKHDNMYFRAYSLIDGKLLYEYGFKSNDPVAYRDWQAYDSSPLICGEADTLIQPGENGVLYTIKLNTVYDSALGKVSMVPSPPVKYTYTTPVNEARDTENGGRWGIEDSAVAWRNYLIFTDNAGLLQCIDLNTMKLVYANDMGNDSDVSMVLEEDPENNTFYLYTGCEYDDESANKKSSAGTAYARKLNGLTGEIIWEVPYNVSSVNTNVDGGILASPVLGREGTSMAGLIIYGVTSEIKGNSTTSRLVALDKLTGQQKWSYDMDTTGWSPSSPVPVYTAEGKGYLIQCDFNGDVALIDGATGVAKDVLSLAVLNSKGEADPNNNFEATPVAYGNTIVVASRDYYIFYITIK